MKRSEFIYLSIFQLFLITVVSINIIATPSTAETSEKSDTITFIHVTDPHICNLTGYHPFFIQKRQHFGKNAEPFSQFLKSVPERQKADFLIITGDNIDYYEAQTEKGGMMDTQIEQYTRLLDLSEVPVYLTLGNHDIASYQVSSDLTYTNNQFRAERARAAWIRTKINSHKS